MTPAVHRAAPVLILLAACSGREAGTVRLPDQTARRGDDPPVALNAESPVEYPATLYARGIEGKVVLRLYVEVNGKLVSESTRVAESSGYPAFDSAAIAGVRALRFAPALKNGVPAAAAFLQPVHFRHPQAGGTTP
ncbi:MAG: energy transducer TonB [Gemmatimonadota bacterium]